MMDITEHPVIRTLLENLGRLEKKEAEDRKKIRILEQRVEDLLERMERVALDLEGHLRRKQ